MEVLISLGKNEGWIKEAENVWNSCRREIESGLGLRKHRWGMSLNRAQKEQQSGVFVNPLAKKGF